VVIGKLGMPRFHALGAQSRQLEVRRLPGGAPVKIAFLEPLSDDDGRSAPFVARLPAGRYEVVAWRMDFLTGEDRQDNPGVEFEVPPGGFTCVGALYPLRLWRATGVPYMTAMIPRDECLVIEQQLRGHTSSDLPPLTVSLAANRLCRSCRAEVAQGGAAPISGQHDAGDLPLLIVEQRRLTGSDQFPLRWPADLPAGSRTVQVKVCVGADGRVGDVSVLQSAHAALDAQVLGHVRAWRFDPFHIEGSATPFCYRPRWELQRPQSR
jgi:TonB family protein